MKTGNVLPAFFTLICGTLATSGQGTFQNLGFEEATFVPGPSGPYYEFAPAFPRWTGYAGGVQYGLTFSNMLALDSAGFSIVGQGFTHPLGLPYGLIEGNYTAVLMSGLAQPNQPADATLTQTGLIPVGTESLWFKAALDIEDLSGSFDVTLGGNTLSLVTVQVATNYTLYAADIHAWAGQTAELAFTVFANRSQHFGDNYLFLDSIQFSDQAAPEPGVATLSFLGALLFGWRAVRRRRPVCA